MNKQALLVEALADLYSNLCNILGKAGYTVTDRLGVLEIKNITDRSVIIVNKDTVKDLDSTAGISRIIVKLYHVGILMDEESQRTGLKTLVDEKIFF